MFVAYGIIKIEANLGGDFIVRNVYVGQERKECIAALTGKSFKWGTVIYVHPACRYYVVEFKCKYDSFREAFSMRGGH